MADVSKKTDGPAPYNDAAAWDPELLPDVHTEFVSDDDIQEFIKALSAPDYSLTSPSEENLPNLQQPQREFITALNDWRPVHQKVKGRSRLRGSDKKRLPPRRGKDETREGWTYNLLKWPLLLLVIGWLATLGISYLLTRLYIYMYEHFVTWRGKRELLRSSLRKQTNYEDWIAAAKELDTYLGSDSWKHKDEYAYYDSKTIRRVVNRLKSLRSKMEAEEKAFASGQTTNQSAVQDLRGLVEACVKNNFAGYENPRLYSETYYGTKDLVQQFVDEVSASLTSLFSSDQLTTEDKRALSKQLSTNFGRTALCLSGGATFAYYHFGIAKALLDADLLPPIITGTSGGALVASLLGTRTNDELKQLLVPALAAKIEACSDPFTVWFRRWWRTGARFDSIDWAKRCSWFCHGSLTFLEAYQRTGRVLNVSCVPSDPHSPTILANYMTAPDCVIWSAVLASAAVPGILNPVVLMRKNKDGRLEPYSFGHKWKDGSLRTDIPLKALNLHFNVNFSIVSQVNPHINLFFFSSRGSVGRPVTHRRGRGWRGGFLGSALEQYLKLDLTKWLKVLRHLELLPRPLGQDWSEIWLQRFSGTITIWPKSTPSDFANILSDPSIDKLANMIHVGQLAAWPKIKFISNRMKIEKVIEEARRNTRVDPNALPTPSLEKSELRSMLSSEDLESLLEQAKRNGGHIAPPLLLTPPVGENSSTGRDLGPGFVFDPPSDTDRGADSPSFKKRFSGWFGSGQNSGTQSPTSNKSVRPALYELRRSESDSRRSSSVIVELERQMRVFSDDTASEGELDDEEEEEKTTPNSNGAKQPWDTYRSSSDTEEESGEEEEEEHIRSQAET
ncbi:hypothetical protein AAFC00_001365 [Neodothiora populina]|uniref:Patatin-like phospholipase domain-containing protein n=1 Tax=Neodothiora populina TaxID=2781224 RepID=A0ABR3PNN3_9PEZI